MEGLTFTPEELKALFELIDSLSGGNVGNVFLYDGSDSLDDPTTSAMVKLFRAVGRERFLPNNLKDASD